MGLEWNRDPAATTVAVAVHRGINAALGEADNLFCEAQAGEIEEVAWVRLAWDVETRTRQAMQELRGG